MGEDWSVKERKPLPSESPSKLGRVSQVLKLCPNGTEDFPLGSSHRGKTFAGEEAVSAVFKTFPSEAPFGVRLSQVRKLFRSPRTTGSRDLSLSVATSCPWKLPVWEFKTLHSESSTNWVGFRSVEAVSTSVNLSLRKSPKPRMAVDIGVLGQCVEHSIALVFERMVSQCRSLGLVQVIDLAMLDDEDLAGIFLRGYGAPPTIAEAAGRCEEVRTRMVNVVRFALRRKYW